MRALWLFRYALLVSVLAFIASLAAAALRIGDPLTAYAIGMVAIAGLIVSSLICVLLQFVFLPMRK